MADAQAAPSFLKRFGKMRVKTFVRWVLGIVALAAAFYAGSYFWRHDGPVDNTASADQTANPPQVRTWTLQAQYTGPLQDTVVQRWADPDNGAICYIYLPVIVQHGKPLQNGLVHYDSNNIGTISCVPAR
jgi:hypothetical protein